MTSDLFESPRSLIDRANEHISEVQAVIQAFFDRQPYAKIIDLDRETHEYVHKIRLTAIIPGRATNIVKDATSNLRDALDHAVYSAAIALGGVNPEKTGFPFANDARHLDGELSTWKFKDIPPAIHPALMRFRPYPGGNDLLIGLNRIRNTNTHRVLVPIGSASMGTALNFSGIARGAAKIGMNHWVPATNEVEYMRLSQQSDFQYDVQVAFDVVFGDIDFVCGKPVVGTLRQMTAEVENVVGALEAETSRLLASRT